MRADWVGRRVVVRHGGQSADGRPTTTLSATWSNSPQRTQWFAEPTASDDDCPSTGSWPRRSSPPRLADILATEDGLRSRLAGHRHEVVAAAGCSAPITDSPAGPTRCCRCGRFRRSLDEVVAAAHDWYGARGLPVLVSCPLPARQALDDALADRGFSAPVDVDVLVAALPAVPPPTEPVEIAPVPIRGLAGRLPLPRRSRSARLRASDPDSARPRGLRDRASRRRGGRRQLAARSTTIGSA